MSVTKTGDYFVVRTGGIAGWLIRLGTRSPYNHAGVVVDGHGRTVEAKPSGACYGNIADYGTDRMLVGCPVRLTSDVRRSIAVHAGQLVGTPYSWLDILALALLQFGVTRPRWIERRVARTDRLVCSGLVDLAYRQAGIELFDDGRPFQDVTPGDLARLLPGDTP